MTASAHELLVAQLMGAAAKLGPSDHPDVVQLLELAAATIRDAEKPPALTDGEISAVIWYTVTRCGHVGWHTFGKLLLEYEQDREKLATVVTAYHKAYAGSKLPDGAAHVHVRKQLRED